MPARKPSRAYSAMFSAALMGVYLLVAGLIGYRVGARATMMNGSRWHDGPIAAEIAIGAVLLTVAGVIFRRLRIGQWVIVSGGPKRPPMKNAGAGRSVGARARQLEPGDEGGGAAAP